jgi:ParB family chromosome partitioning protein
MTETSTAMLDVEKIAIEDGFNPRSGFDERELAELVASVREQGILTALTVRSDGNGGYVLIAGARRLEAAKQVGLGQVPAVVRSADGALAAAIAENLIRADLDPIEEARALQRLAEAEKLATHKQIAARVGKSAVYVSERLRLLALPEGCHGQIAAGAVPVAAERELRKVA